MKVLITGGLGFVGSQLSRLLLQKGHEVTLVGHAPPSNPDVPRGARPILADTTIEGPWQDAVSEQDVVVNLAGASIFRRWDRKVRLLIYDSRLRTTRNVVEALSRTGSPLLLSTSAVGYYGFRGDEDLTEGDGPGKDFLAKLSIDWEKEARKAEERGARVVLTRFGIVLGKTGGALGQMIPAFKKFVGGPLGSGKQWFSWIHMADLLDAMLFVIDHSEISGPVNFCAPNPVRNQDLAKALGKVLHRPSHVTTPAFALRLALGEFGSVLLEGQRVLPKVLLDHGFSFRFPEIEPALRDIIGSKP